MKKITLSDFKTMKQNGEKIVALTAYDASFALVLEQSGVEIILVGDSLGMVIQGHDSTLPVTTDEMIYHTQAVKRGSQNTFIMTDMPFMSDTSPAQALNNAGRILKEGGANMVKLEGGSHMLEVVQQLSERGIPVCGHLGLQPQSINKLGGYRVQGRDEQAAHDILQDAKNLEQAGADMLVLECVPAELAAQVSYALTIPTIGIGAGIQCDGQVLVLQDLLGITLGKAPKFSKNYLQQVGDGGVQAAVSAYVREVKNGHYPGAEHSFR